MRVDLNEFLKQSLTKPVVSDGGMATSLYDKGFYINRSFEELSLTSPEAVKEVSLSFKKAGAQILTTNSFGASLPRLTEYGIQDQHQEILKASVRIAKSVAEDEAYVLGAIGPIGLVLEPLGPTSKEEASQFYQSSAEILDQEGVDGFSLEGFHDLKELEVAIQAVKKVSLKPILPHLGIQEDLKTSFGHSLKEYVELCDKYEVAALGLAGEVGPSGMLSALEILRPLTKKPISLKPNAGLPKYVNGQYIYLCNPDYLGKYAKRFVQKGVNIVGGYSGVGDQHIRAISNALKMVQSSTSTASIQSALSTVISAPVDQAQSTTPFERRSKLSERLKSHKKVFTVEINPPKGVDHSKFYSLCWELQTGGIEFVNIPDGARAMARMSSMQLATYVKNQFGLEPIPHFTSRDRNLLGLQADLLGGHVNGVRNLLLVTGDPPKLGNCPGASGVYDVDAIGLTHIVSRMNQGLDLGGSSFGKPTSFVIGVALNPTAANQDLEIERFKYKIEAGAEYAITQPIYDLEAYQRFLDRMGDVKIPIIMGIWPLVSLRNAEFLKNEVPGVEVPDWVIREMEKTGEDKDESLKRGCEIAIKTMLEAKSIVSGFQVSAPFNRVKVALNVIHAVGGL